MPKIVEISYTCSLCPKSKQLPIPEADVFSFQFTSDGQVWEQVLCQAHGAALKEGAEPLARVAAAPAARSTGTGTRKAPSRLVEREDIPAVRAWLVEQGLKEPGSIGPIKREHQQAWIAAGRPQLPS